MSVYFLYNLIIEAKLYFSTRCSRFVARTSGLEVHENESKTSKCRHNDCNKSQNHN